MKTGIASWMREFCWTQNSRVDALENAATKGWTIRSNSDVVIADLEAFKEEIKAVIKIVKEVSV